VGLGVIYHNRSFYANVRHCILQLEKWYQHSTASYGFLSALNYWCDLDGGSLGPRRCIRECHHLYPLKLSLMFLDPNDACECPSYITNPAGLAKATEGGSTHFDGRDYQYYYYFFYASNCNSHPSLNTRWSCYHSSNFKAASLSSSINSQRVKGTSTRALRGVLYTV
jgi:hypothetical protein